MENIINAYYVYDDKEQNLGHIDRIELPDRDTVCFDQETGRIDLSALADYKGFPLLFHSEGEVRKGYINEVGWCEAKQAEGKMKEVQYVEIAWEEDDDEEE